MAGFININGAWKSVADYFINISGTFKSVTDGWININGTWKRFFTSALKTSSQATISQATNATTKLITLTGTTYYWSPGPPSLSYKFQKSTDQISWTNISTGTATNPAFGSSNSYTYALAQGDLTKNSLNYYRFVIEATYGLSTGSSTSTSTSVQSPTDTTLTEGTAGTNNVNLSWTSSTGAGRYLVYYKDSTAVSYTFFSGTASTSIDVTGLASSTTYNFKVIPVTGTTDANPGYYGNDSNVVTKATTAAVAPGSFSISSVTKGFPVTSSQGAYRVVTINWGSSTDSTGYEYQIESSSDNSTWAVATAPVSNTLMTYANNSTTSTSANPQVNYAKYYRAYVRAYNAGATKTTASNNPISASGTDPGDPSAITASSITQSSVSINYTNGTAGSNTLLGVQYKLGTAGSWSATQTSKPFSISGLTASTSYTVYLRSVNEDGLVSAGSANKAFTTSSATWYCRTKYYNTQIADDTYTTTVDDSIEVCGNYKTVCSTVSTPTGSRPAACTCTASCGSYGLWSDWSAWGICYGGSQDRTRTRSRTCTNADCSTYTDTETQTESQTCTVAGCPGTLSYTYQSFSVPDNPICFGGTTECDSGSGGPITYSSFTTSCGSGFVSAASNYYAWTCCG